VAFRRRPEGAGGQHPRLLVVSGLVLTLQAVLVLATGSVLLFLLQFPLANLALCVLFARTAPTGKPLVAQLAAEVVALRQPPAAHPGLDRFLVRLPASSLVSQARPSSAGSWANATFHYPQTEEYSSNSG
jgi:hypothetical protein